MLSQLAISFTLALLPLTLAQGDLSAANNLTDLEGTWSSNSAVSTGGTFCSPAEMKFDYPTNTGMSYSFTNDGKFEEAQYRYNSNGSNPACIQAVLIWQHGTYTLEDDGSIVLHPFGSDGRVQVQDPCAATTNIITYYDEVTTFKDWGIIVDPDTGNYQLRLNKFDGSKLPYMNLIAKPPNMLPTQTLTGVNASGQTNTRKRSLTSSPLDIFKRSSASNRASIGYNQVIAVGGVVGTVMVGLLALV
ncbi:hypothetical protein L486_00789 [Kwoniella mangroviensis CBS 10435]|uniref:Protein ROT1 n=1 Tax=Kwoniella mangroviensis CBS 10435 TaxID=1331196 RepID=A0A1B9J027_9TREE|nr:uncharacterized protein I203_04322 [Kwoniella mangroviensis CBS 8507]OCF61145.1 hypothetical protein L486_00789 [Kwoniella mangroviensis CBS 10435]OCF66746.1 hypothetical protein I203_04322 [Kwoniella mangroviensis CBS 8507]